MKNLFVIISVLFSVSSFAQNMEIINSKGEIIDVTIFDRNKTKQYIVEFNGVKTDSLRKKWTSRSYLFTNQKILIEFYDGQSVLIENHEDFQKLKEVQFVKNSLERFKKNISYRINILFNKGKEMTKLKEVIKLPKYKSDMPKAYEFEVYRLATKQLLILEFYEGFESATIYKDIKTLASENSSIEEIEYRFEDDEHYMKELANGSSLDDFEPNEHLVYPKFINEIIASHKLILKETKVYVSSFWGNLYESKKGYWVLIDEVNQENGAGNKMGILTLRIYDSLQQVRKDQTNYTNFKNHVVTSEHFYQNISNEYGKNFTAKIDSLISVLPNILNFDKEQLSISYSGIAVLNEALKWNHYDSELFDSWFPSILAYYGAYYIHTHNKGKWESKFNKESKVWIPQITLDNGNSAFNMIHFYKNLYEVPMPIEAAGDFYDGDN